MPISIATEATPRLPLCIVNCGILFVRQNLCSCNAEELYPTNQLTFVTKFSDRARAVEQIDTHTDKEKSNMLARKFITGNLKLI